MVCRLFIRRTAPKTHFATVPATNVANTSDSGENSGIALDIGAWNLFRTKLQTTLLSVAVWTRSSDHVV